MSAQLVRPPCPRPQREQRVAAGGTPATRTRSLPRDRRRPPPSVAGRGDRGQPAPRSCRAAMAHRRARAPGTPSRCCASPNWRIRLACAASVLATTSRPDVSLSSRCTIPGLPTPAMEPSGSPRRLRPTQQGVDQRAGRVARAGMDHQPRRLVDDEHRLVLVGEAQRDRLGSQGGVRRRRELDLDPLAAAQPIAGPRAPAVNQRPTVPNEPLRMRAADPGRALTAMSKRPAGATPSTVRMRTRRPRSRADLGPRSDPGRSGRRPAR